MFNRKIGTISWKIHYPYEGMYGDSAEYIEKTVTGNGYVDLLTAKSGSLSNLTLFGGTVQDDTDVIQSVVLEGATEQRNVPEGYTELDYIRNVQSATKFDTGLKPLVGDVLEIVRTAGNINQSNYLLQSRANANAGIWGISGSQSGNTIIGSWGTGQSVTSNITRVTGHKYYTKMSVTATTSTLEVRDLTDKLSDTQVNSSITAEDGTANYYIRGNSSQLLNPTQNVYYARISNNGVERIKLIPAKQGDTVGFYDMVSKTFMTTFVGDTPIASSAEATAYPYAPMNIVGNNGAIKVHKNLIDKSTVVRGDINSGDGAIATGISYRAVSDFIPILNGQTYTVSGKIRIEGDETEYVPSKPIIALYNSSKNYISGTRALQNSYTFTIDNASASYIRVERRGNPAQGSVVDLENSEFQFQVGPYATAYENGTGIYTEGQTETVQDALGNTATAEMLLKVSISNDYIDTQEVLTGAITRRIAIKVLDGTESWAVNSGDYNFFRLNNAVDFSGNLTTGFYCTHFVPASIASSSNNQGIRLNSNSIFLRFDSLYSATTENLPLFKQWLSDQYAQGTPIIVIYPLTTPTTETVAGQELTTKPVTQTAGSISNMTITVTSDGGVPSPSTPKDIICNNGVLKCSGNLLNREDLEGSYLLTDEGQRGSSNNNWFLTNFIKVKPNTNYIFDFISGGESVYRRICGYSSNDYSTFTELLVKKQRPVTEGVRYSEAFTTSATTNYIKISSYKADTNVQLIEGTVATPYRSYLGIYTEGDIETVKDASNRTATAEKLLKIGTYIDSQEVLSGAVARNVGIKVLNGTENWNMYSVTQGNLFRIILNDSVSNNKVQLGVLCNYYSVVDTLDRVSGTLSGTTTNYDFINDDYTTIDEWKEYLYGLYLNGTPVIVVYPLATETTETVTGQNLNVKSGTNKIEIIQASIDNLGISATYLSRE